MILFYNSVTNKSLLLYNEIILNTNSSFEKGLGNSVIISDTWFVYENFAVKWPRCAWKLIILPSVTEKALE